MLDPGAVTRSGIERAKVDTEHADEPLSRRDDAAKETEQGRLAAAARPDQEELFRAGDMKRLDPEREALSPRPTKAGRPPSE